MLRGDVRQRQLCVLCGVERAHGLCAYGDLSEWGGPVLSCGVFMPLIKVLWGISLVPGLMVMITWVPAIMEQYKVRRPAASHQGPKGSNTRSREKCISPYVYVTPGGRLQHFP